VQASVYRLFHHGVAVDRQQLRQCQPAVGDLELRLRMLGRVPRWNVYLAALRAGDSYLIPPVDHARVVQLSGRWLLIEGEEVVMQRSQERRHTQAWWCRIEAASPVP
jgi:hypothetical protein